MRYARLLLLWPAEYVNKRRQFVTVFRSLLTRVFTLLEVPLCIYEVRVSISATSQARRILMI
jgi:hypothetical protein